MTEFIVKYRYYTGSVIESVEARYADREGAIEYGKRLKDYAEKGIYFVTSFDGVFALTTLETRIDLDEQS